MNSFMYDDGCQCEELPGFKLYETEQQYWEEYDQIHNSRNKLSDNDYVIVWKDTVLNVDSRTFVTAKSATIAESIWRKTHDTERCLFEQVI